MANYITVTNEDDDEEYRVNMDMVLYYFRNTVGSQMGTLLNFPDPDDGPLVVRESVEEIDRILNPRKVG